MAAAFNRSILNSYRIIGKRLFISDDNKKRNLYDCKSNPIKAEAIAKNLIADWYAAYLIAKANNIQFYGVLQPNLQTSVSNTAHLEMDDFLHWHEQFDMVYPLIIKKMKSACKFDVEFCSRLIDARYWIKTKKPVFIDFCHLTKDGNDLIASGLIREIIHNDNKLIKE